jgi:hypothetical protein
MSCTVCVCLFSISIPQVQEAEVQRARLAADKAAADDKTAAAAARLPQVEAEKKAAAAKKVRMSAASLGNHREKGSQLQGDHDSS